MSDDFELSDLFDFVVDAVETIVEAHAEGAPIEKRKLTDSEKSAHAFLSKRADETISKPASPADQLSAPRKREAVEREFWESH